MKTPYKADGDIDLQAYDKLVEHQIANGVEGLIVGSTTGEGHILSWKEHFMLIAHTKAKFGDKLRIVNNTVLRAIPDPSRTPRYGPRIRQGDAVYQH